MTPVELAKLIRLRTRTNSTTFSDVDIISYANIHIDDISAEVIKANEDYFGFEDIRNLEIGKRNYALPPELLSQIKYLQAYINGEWCILREYDITFLEISTDETSIQNAWKGKDPAFMIFGNEIIILSEDSIENVTNGLKIWSLVYPKHLDTLSGTTDISVRPSPITCGFPRQFHELLATAIVIDWKGSQDTSIALTAKEINYNNDLASKLDSIKDMNLNRIIEINPDYDDGSEY